MEPSKIASTVQKIANSGLSVDEYFRSRRVPFSRRQYFRYKARLAAAGPAGLVDGRAQGNHRKLDEAGRGFVRGAHLANPRWGLRQICTSLEGELGVAVDPSTISRSLQTMGQPIRWPRPAQPQSQPSPCAGFELVAALALHAGWAQRTAQLVGGARQHFEHTELYRHQRMNRDHLGRNEQGQFTAAYNRRPEIRTQRFASVEDKRGHHNYCRMALWQASAWVLARKSLALLALPLVTLNGTTRSVNGPLGNGLEEFCGYNYQQATLEKFLRELKYLGISECLLRDEVVFWAEHWRQHQPVQAQEPLLCYYVDGNVKPLWSEQHVKAGNIKMLGRVMGCLEAVFVHDGWGHPLYVETHAGKAPMGEHVLGLMEQIEAALEGPGPALAVNRVIVMDAASNGVGTLRAFAEQEHYHYITALDDNQWHPERVRVQGRPQRYAYGQATLRDCQLELEDSRQPGYVAVVRAVRLDWDYDRHTVLVTSLPAEAVGPSLVVRAYFERWPAEELPFRRMKAFACLNRVAGYGKKKLADERVRQKQQGLLERMQQLRQALSQPLAEIARWQEQEARCISQEQRLRARTQIVAGHRVADPATQQDLQTVRRKRGQAQRQIKALETQCGKSLQWLRDCERRWLRLQGKDCVYRNDVELDQILTYFRVALVNLCSWFLSECLGQRSMSLTQLLHTILLLPGEIQLTARRRLVRLERNPKDPQTMALLAPALDRLNAWQIHDLDDRTIEFALS
jgi:hypothetical protein